MLDQQAAAFTAWFKKHGTQNDSVGLTSFPGMGRGAVALDDIPRDAILFSIPRSLLLNTQTSRLSTLLSDDEQKTLTGWTPLILSMMWESQQPDSLWREYFNIMPTDFDSLMFWSKAELKQLRGSAVLDKIGKEEAQADFHNLVKPLIQKRPDVFKQPDLYDVNLYNRMGSLILSRSFHVEEAEEDNEEQEANGGDTSMASSSGAGNATNDAQEVEDSEEGSDDGEEDESESVIHVSMVPWADMLNARHGCDNARLFYEKDCLNMCSTRAISKGEQIWNVYGDPPNSDLLRRYGHVDLENPSDLVEIKADLVADVACSDQKQERIDFLLSTDLDDIYAFTIDDNEEEMEQLLTAISIFAADAEAFEKMQKKGKVSKKGVRDEIRYLRLARDIFAKRAGEYPHSFEADATALEQPDALSERLKCAIVVRHGEMKILKKLISELDAKLPAPQPSSEGMLVDEEPARKQKTMSKKEMREEKKRQREENKESSSIRTKKSRRT